MKKVVKSNDSIGYKGSVTVKVVGSKNKLNKQYKIKNTGYAPLFDFIAYCLAGSFNSDLCPNYIATYNGDDFANAQVTCSNPISKVSAIKLDTGITELTFTIPGTSLSSVNTNILALYCEENYTTYNSSNRNPSAVVKLTNAIDVNSDESIIVVWQFSIENKQEKKNRE